MQRVRTDSGEALASEWTGAGDARKMPAHSRDAAPWSSASGDDGGARRHGWLRGTLRFARNAIVGLLVLTALPLSVVWKHGDVPPRLNTYDLEQRIAGIERMRPLMAPKDAAITPMQAGLAFRRLQMPRRSNDVPLRAVEATAARPWRTHPVTKEMFLPRLSGGDGPSARSVVQLVVSGYSVDEMAYLRAVAEAPIWKDFDIVTQAAAIDVIGGLYTLPFPSAAGPSMMMPRFADTRELADAALSRGAYYLAIGEPARAEAALRAVVSFGFALIDNATSAMDAVLGRLVVETGRSGLEQLFMVQGVQTTVPSGGAVSSLDYDLIRYRAFESSTRPASGQPPLTAPLLRERLIADAADASLSRGLRYESLSQLSFLPCSNLQETLLGPAPAVRRAFETARRTLARYPSERAYLDLMYAASDQMMEDAVPRAMTDRLIVGAATVAAAVTGNPRIAACTRMALMHR